MRIESTSDHNHGAMEELPAGVIGMLAIPSAESASLVPRFVRRLIHGVRGGRRTHPLHPLRSEACPR